MKKLLLVFALMPFFFSCASKKKLADLQSRLTELQTSSDQAVAKAKADLADCNSLTASLQGEIKKRDADLEAKNGINTGTDYTLIFDLTDYMIQWANCESEPECKYLLQQMSG